MLTWPEKVRNLFLVFFVHLWMTDEYLPKCFMNEFLNSCWWSADILQKVRMSVPGQSSGLSVLLQSAREGCKEWMKKNTLQTSVPSSQQQLTMCFTLNKYRYCKCHVAFSVCILVPEGCKQAQEHIWLWVCMLQDVSKTRRIISIGKDSMTLWSARG